MSNESAEQVKGQSMTTGMVHYAKQVKHNTARITTPMYAQKCGMRRGQIGYLVKTNLPVTCKRCLKV